MKVLLPLFGMLLLSFSTVLLHAQQQQQYSLLNYQKLALNPGFAGLEGTLVVDGLYRQQWLDLEGAPTQQLLQAHLPAWYAGGGIGLTASNETIGARTRTAAQFNYSYHLPVSNKAVIGIGAGVGAQQLGLDGSRLITPDGNYETSIDHQDQLLNGVTESAMSFFSSAGVYLLAERFQMGLSVLELPLTNTTLGTYEFAQVPTFAFTSSYRLPVGRAFEFEPSVLARYSGAQVQTDVNAIFWWHEKYFGGAGVRGYTSNSLDAVTILLGIQLSGQLSFAYAFDNPLSDLKSTHSGSHEVGINYKFARPVGKGKLPPIIYNPRLKY